MAQPKQSPTGNRKVLAGGPTYRFRDPVGRVRLALRAPGMIYVEEELDRYLDEMNRRIADGRGPLEDGETGDRIVDEFSSIWTALPYLWFRHPAPTGKVLAVACLADGLDGTAEEQIRRAEEIVNRQLIPGEYIGEAFAAAAMDAVNAAFGKDVDEAGPPIGPRPPSGPPTSSSDGTSS